MCSAPVPVPEPATSHRTAPGRCPSCASSAGRRHAGRTAAGTRPARPGRSRTPTAVPAPATRPGPGPSPAGSRTCPSSDPARSRQPRRSSQPPLFRARPWRYGRTDEPESRTAQAMTRQSPSSVCRARAASALFPPAEGGTASPLGTDRASDRPHDPAPRTTAGVWPPGRQPAARTHSVCGARLDRPRRAQRSATRRCGEGAYRGGITARTAYQRRDPVDDQASEDQLPQNHDQHTAAADTDADAPVHCRRFGRGAARPVAGPGPARRWPG